MALTKAQEAAIAKQSAAYEKAKALPKTAASEKAMADAHAAADAIRGVATTTQVVNGKYTQVPVKKEPEVIIPEPEVLKPGVTPAANSASLMGAAQLAKLYGITTDRSTIENIYNDATAKSFQLQQNEQKQVANQFMDSIFTGQQTQSDIIRKSNAAAVATGASRGMQAAQEMTALLQNSQQNAAGATNVAQTGALLNDKEQAARAQNAVLALTAANSAGTSLAGIDTSKYAADTQYGVGGLDSNARNYTADQALVGTKYAADANAAAQVKAAQLNASATSSYNSNGVNTATGSNVMTDFNNALKNDPKNAWMILVQAQLYPDQEAAQAYVDSLSKEAPKNTDPISKLTGKPVTDYVWPVNNFEDTFVNPSGGYTSPYK